MFASLRVAMNAYVYFGYFFVIFLSLFIIYLFISLFSFVFMFFVILLLLLLSSFFLFGSSAFHFSHFVWRLSSTITVLLTVYVCVYK